MNQPSMYPETNIFDAIICHEGFAHIVPTYKITPTTPKSPKDQGPVQKGKDTEEKKGNNIKH